MTTVTKSIEEVEEEIKRLEKLEPPVSDSRREISRRISQRRILNRDKRRLQLQKPRTRPEFVATLKWMGQNGGEDDLYLLRQIEQDPPYFSEAVQYLFKIAEKQISERASAKQQGEELVWTEKDSESEIEELIRYLLGYRTLPLLRITPGLGGTSQRGSRDFIRFLLGGRGYIRVDADEQEQS